MAEKMIKERAARQLLNRLTECSEHQAQDVNDTLELGAGTVIHPAMEFTRPTELPAPRRHAYVNLADAIYNGPEPWMPVYAGGWEEVLATLVIDAAWDKIHDAAEDLRADDALVASRKQMREAFR